MPGQADWSGLTVTLPQTSAPGGIQAETADIAAGGSETVTIASAAGTISVLDAWWFFGLALPSGATAGSHQAFLASPEGISLTLGQSAYNSSDTAVQFQEGFWVDAGETQRPPAGTNQSWWAGIVVCTSSAGFGMTYQNNTNVTQTAKRQYGWQMRQEAIP